MQFGLVVVTLYEVTVSIDFSESIQFSKWGIRRILTASLYQYKFISRGDTEQVPYLFRCGDRYPVRGEQKREIISHIHPTDTGLLGDRK